MGKQERGRKAAFRWDNWSLVVNFFVGISMLFSIVAAPT